MKEEKSLIKTNNNIFSRIVQSIKRFFSRNKKYNYQTNELANTQENSIRGNETVNFQTNKFEKETIENNYVVKQNITTNINQKLQMNTELQDMKTLQQVMQGQVQINNLEENTIDRLIVLCSNRLKEVNKKIEHREAEIYKNKKLTTALKQV